MLPFYDLEKSYDLKMRLLAASRFFETLTESSDPKKAQEIFNLFDFNLWDVDVNFISQFLCCEIKELTIEVVSKIFTVIAYHDLLSYNSMKYQSTLYQKFLDFLKYRDFFNDEDELEIVELIKNVFKNNNELQSIQRLNEDTIKLIMKQFEGNPLLEDSIIKIIKIVEKFENENTAAAALEA